MDATTPYEVPAELPAEQRAIRSRCFHASGSWVYMDPDAGARTIHELVEARAAAIPDAIAVVSPHRSLRYRTLNLEANRLACHIVGRAEAADAPVAVCCSLGPAQVIAILAVFKAARFFVSLPPSDPPERNRRLVHMTGARTVITDRANAHIARQLFGDERAVLNADSMLEANDDDLCLDISADALIRLAMTSGSTGEPKGIMQTHRTALFNAIARNNAVHLCAEDRMLMATATFTELWRPLLVGATLYLFDLKADDMNCLRRWFAEERVSAFRSTPSVFRQLVALLAQEASDGTEANPVAFPWLRVVELMGEPVSAECVRLFREHFPQSCVLINFLGSKEVLDYRIFYMDHETRIDGDGVPAGYPLADTRVFLLDDAGKPSTTGDVGEIAVVSRSLSPGYWRRADLTNDRFACDSTAGNTRFFRTGDLGRLMPDGCLVYLGRRDSMVKIRGQRVEVEDLEQSIRALDGVADVAVVAVPTAREDLELVAFVAARIGTRLDERDLRRELGRTLPDFMIPSAFLLVEALPTTPMGKTDRHALRAIARLASLPQVARSHLPSDALEDEIARIWSKILNREQVSLDENFFELGGNSLMIMQIAAMMQKRFEIDLPLTVLFERPTVRALATYVRESLPVPQ